MAQDDIQRSLGRIEGRLDAIEQDGRDNKKWQQHHSDNDHGSHGRRILNRSNAQGVGLIGLIVAEIVTRLG